MKKNIMIVLLMVFVTPFLSGVSLAILTPVADGHYSDYAEGCFGIYSACDHWGSVSIESGITIRVFWDMGPGGICDACGSYNFREGIIEFDISGLDGLFTSGQIEAVLSLTVQDGYLPDVNCLSLYNIQDENENGVIEEVDIDTQDFIGEVCEDLQSGDIITFDVTTAIEHDLYDPDQTDFSGFILRSSGWSGVDSIIEFYDHTNPTYAPRLSISDGDVIDDEEDNCPYHYNPLQEDTYPPEGNGIGDACDCECDFDCSGGVDAIDVDAFLGDFGRSTFNNPCTNAMPCNGDVDCNGSCDASDVNKFLADFGRSQFNNPCPPCVAGNWCVY